jgi:hypothetical protein
MVSDFKMQIARARLLVRITDDRKELVRICLYILADGR